MQPRLRTLVWKELPPCVRRNYVWVSRRLFHAELLLGRLYLSWTRSPTWNFVAVAGTLGILLTILLFLVPWADQPVRLQAEIAAAEVRQEPRPWELDSRLSPPQASVRDDYPVEFAFAERSQLMALAPRDAEEEIPPRRRRRAEPESPDPFDEPSEPPRQPAPPNDWLDDLDEPESPPELDLEIEFLASDRRRRRREPEPEVEVKDVSLSARTAPADDQPEFDFIEATETDDWQAFDAARSAGRDLFADDSSLDQPPVGADDGEANLSAWIPAPFPDSAPDSLDIGLELSWHPHAVHRSRRRPARHSPELHLRHLGSIAASRVDLVRGEMAEVDFTIAQSFLTQSLSEFRLDEERTVLWNAADGGHRSGQQDVEVVSVIVTTFVGHEATVIPAARPDAPPVVATPAPSRRRRTPAAAPVEPPRRPHLTLATGPVQRIAQFHLLSVPMRVVNDGDMPLDNVIIVAEIPAELTHRFGPTIHYRVGALRPGERRQTHLLLTPNESGRATVQLAAADAGTSASADAVVELRIADQDVPRSAPNEPPETELPETPPPRATRERVAPPSFDSSRAESRPAEPPDAAFPQGEPARQAETGSTSSSEDDSSPWRSTRRRRRPPP